MIRHTSTRRADTVSDAVGCLRVFGGVFVLTGTMALSVGAFGLAGMGAEPWYARGAVVLIGAAHVLGGLAVAGGRWRKSVVTRGGVEHVEHRPLRAARRRHIAPSEVRDVLIRPEEDGDGDEQYALSLKLVSGERVPLTRHCTPSKGNAEAIRDAVLARLGVSARLFPSGDGAPRRSGVRPLAPEALSRRRSPASPPM